METLYLCNTNKRTNSTLDPHGLPKNGVFREPFSILSPSFDIEISGQFSFNYLYWHDNTSNIDRYYWIKNKVYFPNGIVRVECEEDVLATLQNWIRGSEFLVERCYHNTEDPEGPLVTPEISDAMPITLSEIIREAHTTYPFPILAHGSFVIGISGSNSAEAFQSFGGVYYYWTDFSGVASLVSFLNGDGADGTWADYNPLSRVVSIKYFPIDISRLSHSGNIDIFVHNGGQESWNWQANFVTPHDVQYVYTIELPVEDHAQYTAEMKYLNFPPYREIELFAGPFGKVLIPSDKVSFNFIQIKVYIDLISGLSRLEVHNGFLDVVFVTEDYSCSVDCTISAEMYNRYTDLMARDLRRTQAISQIASMGASGAAAVGVGIATANPMIAGTGAALTINALGTALTGYKQWFLDSYAASVPDNTVKGTNGSFSMMTRSWECWTISRKIIVPPFDIVGYPYGKKELLGNIKGYCKCQGASFTCSIATLYEIEKVNEFLNNGLFIEVNGQ